MARKINVKLIMELRDAGLSRSTIASTRHISRHSVSEVFNIADEKGIRYDDVRALEETEVYRIFYPEKFANETMYGDPDYEHVHQELKRVGVTLKLLHEEYVERCERNGEIPMGKTKFNEGYAEFTIANRLTNHLEHKPGERAEVDWSGPTMHYVDMSTGELITVYLFVGTLPYSQYSYVEPCLDMKMDTFIRCHIRMYEYFGGAPVRTVCDNLKTGVVSHPKEGEIILTDDYAALGSHYMTAIMPAGVRKPKQKPSVEGTVGKIATAIIARCRNDVYYSFAELRKGVADKLYKFNHEAFQKRDGSRYEVLQEEKEFLRPLPDVPYEIAEWVYGYDPRVAKIGDKYYVTWCNGYHGPTIGIAWTDDFETFHQLENAFLPYNRNGVLFPRKIGGRFAMLSRPSDTGHTPFGDIFYSESPDMEFWGRHRHVMSPSAFEVSAWQCMKIGAGPVPIETSEGWLLFYHGVLRSCNGYVYAFGSALLDLEEPWKVTARSGPYLISPRETYECMGDVPNVTFPCASLHDPETGRIAVYYGCADTVTGLAFGYIPEIIDFTKKNNIL